MKIIQDYYRNRFSQRERENKLRMWKILCKYSLQNFVSENSDVIDLGAGYCEFINTINCKRKVAVDINPDTKKYANKDVEVINKRVEDLAPNYFFKFDVVFMSNFLEHLDSKEEVIETLITANKLLKKGGRLIVIQPNINLIKEHYWDFTDHKIALNSSSIKEGLEIANFKTSTFIERFLPSTTKRVRLFPFTELALKVYLFLPPYLRPFAGQSLAIAIKV